MSDKSRTKLRSLAQLLRDRKTAGIEPYVLFIGAGASISSGCSSGSTVIADVLSAHAPDYDTNSTTEEETFTKFSEILEGMSQTERFATLQRFLDSVTPSGGYNALARLVQDGYFRLIFTTNFDPLLEKAIQREASDLRMEKLVVGREKEEQIAKMLKYRNIDVVIVKLHGDLNSRILAYTEEEVLEFCDTVERPLMKYLSEDVIIVGSRMQDHDIRRCLRREGGSIWYVNPEPPTGLVKAYMKARDCEENFICGNYGFFDNFFQELHDELIRRTPENFLRALGIQILPKDSENLYLHIGELFVGPKLYRTAIKPILEEHHIVFILGDPHVGKTYTAVHLLWELYRAGYEPFWVSTSQFASLFQTSGAGYALLTTEYLRSGRAVYLEDPFGRTTPLEIQEFTANLHEFLLAVKQLDTRVIITSRSSIFNTAVQEKYAKYTVTLSQKLELGKAYDDEDLKEIVRRYAYFYNSKWIHDKNWIQAVDAIARKLAAPHNIELFVRATRQIKAASAALAQLDTFHDVAVEFGREIARLPLWQKGFLLCVYFFSNLNIPNKVTKRMFESATNSGIFGNVPPYPWDCAVTALDNYLTLHKNWMDQFYSLRHPSLEEGFDSCVDSDPALSEIVKTVVIAEIADKDPNVRVAAFNCFLHYSSKFGNTEWVRQNMKQFLESPETYIRESSRNYIILECDNLFPEFREEVLHHAEKFWNERFLLKLLIGARLGPELRKRLALKLAVTWDTWVRNRLARNLDVLAEDAELAQSIGQQVLNDDSAMVRRAAAENLLSMATLRPEPDWQLARLVVAHARNDKDYGVRLEIHRILSNAIKQGTTSTKAAPLLSELLHFLGMDDKGDLKGGFA